MAKAQRIKVPRGFKFAVVSGNIKYSGRTDMGLIYSEVEATAAGVFTTNRVRASNIDLNKRKLRSEKGQAIIVNSGNANACTGEQGIRDTAEMSELTAGMLGIQPSRTFVCSTGVIGTPMPMNNVRKGITDLIRNLGNHSMNDVARAIMTTDKFPKTASKQLMLGGKKITVSACAKGAGMIDPNMATMLCFITTDAAVEPKALRTMLKDVANETFNTITVDGDMSTSDTVLIFANGIAGNKTITMRSIDYRKFQKTLFDICFELAEMMVRDGEGATKVAEIELKGAKSRADAKKAVDSIANSLLVKTAIYGNDANWGRILAAVGSSGITFDPQKVDIYFDDLQVVKNSVATGKDSEANKKLKKKKIKILVDLKYGHVSSRALTCDLTEEYVKINSQYRT
jgi:glutamate N-acetyltransferase/amino-acid N-acetyltransferase